MPALDLQKVAACLRDLEELFKQAGISHHPALITFRCVDPRHNNRTIISTTRQHAFAQWIGEDDVNRLIDWYGMKEFNCAANELVKNFDATSLGGRYSFDNPSLIKFAMNPGVREAGIRLQRI